jgi:hypothetical protein
MTYPDTNPYRNSIIDFLPDTDETLMVTWIGNLYSDKSNNLNIVLRLHSIAEDHMKDRLDPQYWGKSETTYIDVPISALPGISLGSVWRKRQLVSELNPSVIKADRIIIPASPNGNLREMVTVEKELNAWEWNRGGFSDTPCVKTLGIVNKKRMPILIPASEIARFYWGILSSRFFRDICIYGIDSERGINWALESQDRIQGAGYIIEPSSNELRLWLHNDYNDGAAYMIARILGCSEARKQAAMLHRQRQVAKVKYRDNVFLGCSFPFTDGTKIRVFGKKIKRKDTFVYLVLDRQHFVGQFL